MYDQHKHNLHIRRFQTDIYKTRGKTVEYHTKHTALLVIKKVIKKVMHLPTIISPDESKLEYYYSVLNSEKDHTNLAKGFQLPDTRIHNPIEQYSTANT